MARGGRRGQAVGMSPTEERRPEPHSAGEPGQAHRRGWRDTALARPRGPRGTEQPTTATAPRGLGGHRGRALREKCRALRRKCRSRSGGAGPGRGAVGRPSRRDSPPPPPPPPSPPPPACAVRGRMWGAGGGVSTSSGNSNLWLPSSIKAISSRGDALRGEGGVGCGGVFKKYIFYSSSPFARRAAEQRQRSGAPPATRAEAGSRRRGHRNAGGGPWPRRPAEPAGTGGRPAPLPPPGEETQRPPWRGAGGSPGCS